MARFREYLVLLLLVACGCRAGGASRSDATLPHTPATAPDTPVPATDTSVEKSSLSSSLPSDPRTEIQQVSAEIAAPETLPLPQPHQGGANGLLSLLGTVSLALAQNPDLIALRQTERVALGAQGVANTYPFNPWLQVQYTPFQFDDPAVLPDIQGNYVLLMQRIQLAHQQRHREDAGRYSLNAVRWNIHQAELQAVSLTAQLYFTVLYQRGLLEIAQASQANNEQLLQALVKRFEAGDATGAEAALVRVDTRATYQQLRLADANYETACRVLRQQLGLPPASPQKFQGDLRATKWRLPTGKEANQPKNENIAALRSESGLDTWVARLAGSRPDVLNARANIDVARANLRLAAANRVPDLNIGPFYQQNPDGLIQLGFRVDTNLPVIDSGRPMQVQRSAELGQMATVWQQLRVRAELEAQAAYERYELAYKMLTTEFAEESSYLPKELEGVERQFLQSEVDVVQVIQARTSILQNQRSRLDVLNEVAQSAALLVGASGMPLEWLVSF